MDGWGFLDCILLGMMIEYGGSVGLVGQKVHYFLYTRTSTAPSGRTS